MCRREHLGHTIDIFCSSEETLSKHAHVHILQVGSGQMQRKLNLGNNGCKECSFLKLSISKCSEGNKISWINSQNQRLSGWDEILASIKSCSRPQCVKNHQQIPRPTCRYSESVFLAQAQTPAFLTHEVILMQRLEHCIWQKPFYNDITTVSVKFGNLFLFILILTVFISTFQILFLG